MIRRRLSIFVFTILTATLVGSFFAPGKALADGGRDPVLLNVYPDDPPQLGRLTRELEEWMGVEGRGSTANLNLTFSKDRNALNAAPEFSVKFNLSDKNPNLRTDFDLYLMLVDSKGTTIEKWDEYPTLYHPPMRNVQELDTSTFLAGRLDHWQRSSIDNPLYFLAAAWYSSYQGDTLVGSGRSNVTVAKLSSGQAYPIVIEKIGGKSVDYRKTSAVSASLVPYKRDAGSGRGNIYDVGVSVPYGDTAKGIVVKSFRVKEDGFTLVRESGNLLDAQDEDPSGNFLWLDKGVPIGEYLYAVYIKSPNGSNNYETPQLKMISVNEDAAISEGDFKSGEWVNDSRYQASQGNTWNIPKIELPGLTGEIFNPLNTALGGSADNGQLGSLVARIINWAVAIAGLLAIIFIIISGYQYMTSVGDPGQAKNAMGNLTFAIIGLVVVLTAYVIINTIVRDVLNVSIEGDQAGDYVPQVEELNNGV